jgi:Rrf2 family nitric oxide-sensitive transcriptional repressor
MRITAFTDYSLRTLMFVAQAPEGHTTVADAARGLAVSENHLVKVVHALGALGMLRNLRGRGGGISLAASPASINVGRVVRLSETLNIAECFDAESNTCALAGRCRLEGVFHEALDAFLEVLDRYTLEDLMKSKIPLQ